MNLVPDPPACPRCASKGYAREGFFASTGAGLGKGEIILGRCENCGLRRLMLADGRVPPLRARARWVPRKLLKRVLASGPRALLLAPAGTDIFSVRSVTRWREGFPPEPLDFLWIWLSLEERPDVDSALAQVRGFLRPGGMLRITAVNAGALGFHSGIWRGNYLEPLRQRILFTPGLLAGFLRDAGFKRGRLSYNLIRPIMRAEAFRPE